MPDQIIKLTTRLPDMLGTAEQVRALKHEGVSELYPHGFTLNGVYFTHTFAERLLRTLVACDMGEVGSWNADN